ncbi:MAG: hypothetical protein HFJ30_04745 [Clostridia bacterium]|jgi:hypothetical protein|nr:hypothetical protein [Clostridia bacterium]MCI9413473.1 hypothetical protein [Clostridia bacterium]
MEDKRKKIDELIEKLDKMLKEGKTKEETEKVVNEIERLLREFLEE